KAKKIERLGAGAHTPGGLVTAVKSPEDPVKIVRGPQQLQLITQVLLLVLGRQMIDHERTERAVKVSHALGIGGDGAGYPTVSEDIAQGHLAELPLRGIGQAP